MRHILLLLLLAAPAAAADLSGLDWTQRTGATLPLDAPLREADGAWTTLRAAAAGRPLLLAPGYYRCPNLCGVVRDDVFAALGAAGLVPGRDVSVALLTIDPSETAADAHQAEAGILDRHPGLALHALTGPAASLDSVAAAAGFDARFDPASKQFLHPAGLLLAAPDGAITGYLLGVGYAASDMAAAVARARDGVVQAADPIRLFCFTYDPHTGRVGLVVMTALRGMAVATVLAIAGFVAWQARRR